MSKANLKGKIIIGVGATIIVGGISFLIYSAIRKKKISDRIYKALNDTSGENFKDMLKENEQILGSYAFNTNFWKGVETVKPDPKFFNNFSTTDAREIARNIYNAQANIWRVSLTDDEAKIVSEIKKLKSQGQVSLVAHMYANTPLNYGNMGADIISATTGFFDDSRHIKEINNYINNLPY